MYTYIFVGVRYVDGFECRALFGMWQCMLLCMLQCMLRCVIFTESINALDG